MLNMLHLYENCVDCFVAENLEEAKVLAKEYYAENRFDEDEMDLDLVQTSDDTHLSLYDETEDKSVKMTAAEFAQEYGKGFLMSTEY